jgi:RNA polymerase sigma-70 factor (ECF subfamily)
VTAVRREAPPEAQPAPLRPEEEAALVARAAGGDETAFRELYDRHRPAVFRVARAFASLGPDDVDDVVQEAFVRAFRSLPRLREPERFGAWILTIARNRALSRLARDRAAAALAGDLEHEVEAAADGVAPEGDVEAELRIVRRIVDDLPEGPEKDTVRLFYVEGRLSAREIAERLGVGKSAITMRLERFRAKVRRRLLAEVARARGEES